MKKAVLMTAEQAKILYEQNKSFRDTILSEFTDEELGIEKFGRDKPKPLFVTEDGVKVFDGDRYIYIHDLQIYSMEACKENAYLIGEIRFKHEENAEKYIEENKPKPLFVTEDGVEMTHESLCIWEVPANFLKIRTPLWCADKKNSKLFYNEHIADKYIKENKPLFTTEDGVKVLSDIDNLYAVNLTYFNKTKNTLRHSGWLIENSAYKVFYHESNADEYIWRNKRVFSYEDVVEWYGYGFKLGREGIYETLERIAKERK